MKLKRKRKHDGSFRNAQYYAAQFMFHKGKPYHRSPQIWEEDSISPSTLIFAAIKG